MDLRIYSLSKLLSNIFVKYGHRISVSPGPKTEGMSKRVRRNQGEYKHGLPLRHIFVLTVHIQSRLPTSKEKQNYNEHLSITMHI